MIAQNRLNSCHSLSRPFLMRIRHTFDSLTQSWNSCIFFLKVRIQVWWKSYSNSSWSSGQRWRKFSCDFDGLLTAYYTTSVFTRCLYCSTYIPLYSPPFPSTLSSSMNMENIVLTWSNQERDQEREGEEPYWTFCQVCTQPAMETETNLWVFSCFQKSLDWTGCRWALPGPMCWLNNSQVCRG
jgi:hypothetical protein